MIKTEKNLVVLIDYHTVKYLIIFSFQKLTIDFDLNIKHWAANLNQQLTSSCLSCSMILICTAYYSVKSPLTL